MTKNIKTIIMSLGLIFVVLGLVFISQRGEVVNDEAGKATGDQPVDENVIMAPPVSDESAKTPTAKTPQKTETPKARPAPSSPSAKPVTVTESVRISNYSYNSNVIYVKKGTTVRWTNNDSVAHTVTSDNGLFGSPLIAPGSSYTQTFNTIGSFAYHCMPHPMMKGMVVVTE